MRTFPYRGAKSSPRVHAGDPAAIAAKLQAAFPAQIASWSAALATQWYTKDPAAVKAWTGTLPAGSVKDTVMENIASAEQREAGARTGGTFTERTLNDLRLLRYVSSSTVLRLGTAGRASLLAEMSTAHHSDSRFNQLRKGFEEYYPAEYARWLDTVPDTDARSRQVRDLANRWGAAEPASAATWVVTLPEGETRADALNSVAQQWSATDPAAAEAWVQSFSPGPERDRLQHTLASPR